MRKHIIKILLVSSLAASLVLSGCTKEETPAEVTTPEETTHVTDETSTNGTEETATEEGTEDAAENDSVVYDPDKEELVYDEYKLSLYDGYSTVKAQEFLKDNIKFLSVEMANQAILDLEERLKENQNYYINQIMDEKIQNAILVAYNVEEHTFSMDDFKDDNYRTLVQTIIDNGYKFFPEEGLFYPIVDYRSLQAYDKFTSDEIRSYVALMARDSDAPNSLGGDLEFTTTELATRLLMAEEHMMSYPEGQTFETIYDAYKMYMQFYTSSLAYMGGFDTETREISQKLRDSYETFVTENPKSITAAIIKDYLSVLKKQDYKIDNDVLNYLQDFDDVIVKFIAEISLK